LVFKNYEVLESDIGRYGSVRGPRPNLLTYFRILCYNPEKHEFNQVQASL